MRLSYRLNLSLISGIVVTSLSFTLYQTVVETRGLRADSQRNATILAESLERSAAAMVERNATSELLQLVNRYATNSGRTAVAVYDSAGINLAVTSGFSTLLPAS